MVAETLAANQAGTFAKVYKNYIAGMTHTAFGTYAIPAAVEVGDIFQMCKIPAGSLVVGGAVWGTDMDSNGTPLLDMDCGWANNGAGTETLTVADGTVYTNGLGQAADPDGFVNAGVWTGTAITSLIAGGNYRPFLMSAGPIYFARQTIIQIEAIAVAATFVAGTVYTEVRYLQIG